MAEENYGQPFDLQQIEQFEGNEKAAAILLARLREFFPKREKPNPETWGR